MTTKKKKKRDVDFPGYPKYGAEEDITRNASRVDENLDDEVLTQVKHHEEPKPSKVVPDEGVADQNNLTDADENAKNNFDVSKEDLEALGPEDLSMDMGDDEQLKHRVRPVDFTGEDLDTPGTELDDDQEEVGSEDEENNNYSLGGDDKNNLEESQEFEGSL
jgi:hypothetical protein